MDTNIQLIANVSKCMETVASRSLLSVVAKKRNRSEEHIRRVLSDYFQLASDTVLGDDTDDYKWVNHLDKGSSCDLNLMQAGISDLTFHSSTFVFPVTFGQKILKHASSLHLKASFVDKFDVERDSVFSDLVNSLRAKIGKPQNNGYVFIPITEARYWGCVVINFNSAATKALIQWGDVVRGGISLSVLSLVSFLFQRAFPNVECTITHTVNYVLDVCHFAQQEDTRSSGFFILQVLSSHAQTSRYFPSKDWPKYDLVQIEEIRDACAASYIHHLLDLHANNSNGLVIKRGNVFQYLLSITRPELSTPNTGYTVRMFSKNHHPLSVTAPHSLEATQESRIVNGSVVGSAQFAQLNETVYHEKEFVNRSNDVGGKKAVSTSTVLVSKGNITADRSVNENLENEMTMKTTATENANIIAKASIRMEENKEKAVTASVDIKANANEVSDSGVHLGAASYINGDVGEGNCLREAVEGGANADMVECVMTTDAIVDITGEAALNKCKRGMSDKSTNMVTEKCENAKVGGGGEEENDASQAENNDDNADGVNDETPNTTVVVQDIVEYFKDLASQGFFFGNTSHQGLKGRSTRGQLYRAYIQLRCIKYPGDHKHGIPRCPAKLRFDKLREHDGWHASLFSEHSHPPLPEKLRSRRESQVIQTLRDMQMWYLSRDISPKLAGQIVDRRTKGALLGNKSDRVEQRSVAEKILPRPPHMHPVLLSHVGPSSGPNPERTGKKQLIAHHTPQNVISQPIQSHGGIQRSHSRISFTPADMRSGVTIHPDNTRIAPQPQEFAVLPPEQQSLFPFPVPSGQTAQRAPVPIAPRDIGTNDGISMDGRTTMRGSLYDALSTSTPNSVYNSPYFPLSTPNLNEPNSSTRRTAVNNNINCESSEGHFAQTNRSQAVNNEMQKDSLKNVPILREAAKMSTKLVSEEMPHTHTNGFSQDVSVGLSSNVKPMADVFRSNGEDLIAVKNGGATLALVEAIRAYVNTSHLKLAENEMAHHIKKIAEQCGFKLRIRRSMYHAGEENVFIKSATFECAQKVRNGCPFAFRLRGHLKRRRCNGSSEEDVMLGSEKELEANQNQIVYTTSVQFLELEHNHEHDDALLQKNLAQPPANSVKHAISLVREDRITVGNVIRQVEKKHSFIVPRASLRKRIKEERETRDPLAQQCNGLVARLIELKNKDPSIFVHFSPEGPQNTLSRICWSFSEWQSDYMDHGRIPGIYVDTQHLASLFNLPLVSINGRTNTGDTAVFFVAFVAEKNEGSMKWLFEQFKLCMSRENDHTPKIIAVEEHPTMVNTARSTFSSSWLLFDEERLKQYEGENLRSFLGKMDMMHMAEELSSRLQKLREACSHDEFVLARKSIENAFFSQLSNDNKIPQWFKYLYYTEKNLAIHCFNRKSCGLHFAFDGVSYALGSSTSIHDLCVENTSIESYKVPEVMRQAANARRILQIHKRKQVSSSLIDLLVDANVYSEKFRIQLGLPFVQAFTDFCVHYLTKKVVPEADEWQTVRAEINPNGEENASLKKVTFHVIKHSNDEIRDTEPTQDNQREVVLKWCRSQLAEEPLELVCECTVANTTGMPCEHKLAVIRSFNSESEFLKNERAYLALSALPLNSFVHDYWKRDLNAWRALIPKIRFEGLSSVHISGTDQPCEFTRRESQCHVEYVTNKGLFEEAWSIVKSMDDKQRAAFQSSLKNMVVFCHRRQVPLISAPKPGFENDNAKGKRPDGQNSGSLDVELSQSEKRLRNGEDLITTQQKRQKNNSSGEDFVIGYERSEMANDHMQIGEMAPGHNSLSSLALRL